MLMVERKDHICVFLIRIYDHVCALQPVTLKAILNGLHTHVDKAQ